MLEETLSDETEVVVPLAPDPPVNDEVQADESNYHVHISSESIEDDNAMAVVIWPTDS